MLGWRPKFKAISSLEILLLKSGVLEMFVLLDTGPEDVLGLMTGMAVSAMTALEGTLGGGRRGRGRSR